MAPHTQDHRPRPIAIFDSGLGGLTVVRALRRRLPEENLVYFGDTARVPYGAKSPRTVLQFARQCLRFLMRMQPKLLVVACNTVSATALDSLHREFSVPLIGVLEPGAAAAVRVARNGRPRGRCVIGLIATEATIASGAYPQAVKRLDPEIHLVGLACPLLVPMIEEDRPANSPIVRAVLEDYLEPLRQLHPPALILGCTHYPLYAQAIGGVLGAATELIDSADQTALVVAQQLATIQVSPPPATPMAMAACGPAGNPAVPPQSLDADAGDANADLRAGETKSPVPESGSLLCYVTDQGQRFESQAGRFLGRPIGQPVWVDPDWLENASEI